MVQVVPPGMAKAKPQLYSVMLWEKGTHTHSKKSEGQRQWVMQTPPLPVRAARAELLTILG